MVLLFTYVKGDDCYISHVDIYNCEIRKFNSDTLYNKVEKNIPESGFLCKVLPYGMSFTSRNPKQVFVDRLKNWEKKLQAHV